MLGLLVLVTIAAHQRVKAASSHSVSFYFSGKAGLPVALNGVFQMETLEYGLSLWAKNTVTQRNEVALVRSGTEGAILEVVIEEERQGYRGEVDIEKEWKTVLNVDGGAENQWERVRLGVGKDGREAALCVSTAEAGEVCERKLTSGVWLPFDSAKWWVEMSGAVGVDLRDFEVTFSSDSDLLPKDAEDAVQGWGKYCEEVRFSGINGLSEVRGGMTLEKLPAEPAHSFSLSLWLQSAAASAFLISIRLRDLGSVTFSSTQSRGSFCILTTFCVPLEAISMRDWYYIRISVEKHATAKVCLGRLIDDFVSCLFKQAEDEFQGKVSSVIEEVTIETDRALIADLRLIFGQTVPSVRSTDCTEMIPSQILFEHAKNTLLPQTRRLQSVRSAFFSVASPGPTHLFAFRNTYKDALDISISASIVGDTGTITMNVYKDGATVADWSDSKTDSASVNITPTFSLKELFNIEVVTASPIQISVTVNYNGSAVCLSGQFADPDSGSCMACPAGNAQCEYAETLGCLPVSVGVSSVAAGVFNCSQCPSGKFWNSVAGACQDCDPQCQECIGSTSNDCSSCLANASVQSTVSACACNAGFYPGPDSSNCLVCNPLCATCFGASGSECILCISSAIVSSSSASTCECDFGLGLGLTGCEACVGLCSSCTAPAINLCLTCKTSAIRVDLGVPSECQCASTHYRDSNDCKPCSVTCLTCSGPLDSDCLQCHPHASQALPASSACDCIEGYYPKPNASDCKPCHSTCKSCTEASDVDCRTCKINAEPTGIGGCACTAGFYMDTSNWQCTACDPRCATCRGSGTADCLSCLLNASLDGGVSPNLCHCVDGYFGEAFSCQSCHAICATCVAADALSCLTCKSQASLAASAPSACACVTGWFLELVGYSCIACSPQCVTCVGALPSECSQCQANAHLLSTPSSTCLCDDSFYPSPDPSLCLPCDLSCLTCNNGAPTGCRACKPNASLNAAGSCLCYSGFYMTVDTRVCAACDIACVSCSGGSSLECSSCGLNAMLANGSGPSACVCVDGFIGAPESCQACFRTCKTCSDVTENACLSCKTFAHLDPLPTPTYCNCDDGYYLNKIAYICYLCKPECVTCTGGTSNQCVLCTANAQRTNLSTPSSSCACLIGFYPNTTPANCSACSSVCRTCKAASTTDCTSCNSNATLGTTCTCNIGFYPNPDAGSCKACDVTCYECVSYTAADCISCKIHATLVGGSNGNCVCDSNAFPSPNAGNCVLCHETCLTCNGALKNNCLTCKSFAVLSSKSCNCLTHYYPFPSSANCLVCDPTCLNCSGPSSTQCMSCKTGGILVNSAGPCACICYRYGYYPVPDASNCVACDISCSICLDSSPKNCTYCKGSSRLKGPIPNECVCITNYTPYPTTGNCVPCHPDCLECVGITANDCTLCPTATGFVVPTTSPGPCDCPTLPTRPCFYCNLICKACAGSGYGQCTECYDNAYLVTNTPVTAFKNSRCYCNPGFFPSPNYNNCLVCDLTCYWCNTVAVNGCTYCWGGAELAGPSPNKCVCALGYFENPTSRNCTLCTAGCAHCISVGAALCLDCFSNASLTSGTAPSSCVCNPGYYPSGSPRNCLVCDAYCKTCVGPNKEDCASCYPNSTLSSYPNTSACMCNAGFYPNPTPGSCSACYIACKTCTGGASTDCGSCFSNAHIYAWKTSGACVCNDTFFPNTTENNCQVCDSTCYQCVDASSSSCTKCYAKASVVGGTVGTCQCNVSYMPAPTSATCQGCFLECYSCVGTLQTDCTRCFSHASLYNNLARSKCVCDEGYFPDSTALLCSACPSECKACTEANNCTACFTGGTLQVNSSNDRLCVCTILYFPNPTPRTCTSCHSDCTSCFGAGANNCLSCGANATLSSNKCLCSTSDYKPPLSPNCYHCHSTCVACMTSNTASYCTQCFLNAKLAGTSPNTCVCQDGYFPLTTSNNCQQCDLTCAKCTNLNMCSVCIANAEVITVPGPCNCIIGFYFDSGLSQCIACHPTCSRCTEVSSVKCTACYTNAQLTTLPGSCVCKSAFFPSPDSSNCLACSPTCAQCIDALISSCTACYANASQSINPGTCQCSTGYFPNPHAGICTVCYTTCKTCDLGTSTHCLSCKLNAHLVVTPGPNACVCDDAYYLVANTGGCAACDFTCVTCVAPGTLSACTLCKAFAALSSNPGKCICIDGYYPNGSAADCRPCDPTCAKCSNGTISGCTACFTYASIEFNAATGKCVCDTHYWPNLTPTTCGECDPTCLNCIDSLSTNCISCPANAILFSTSPSSCVCDTGFYRAGTNPACVACDLTCKNCVGGLSSQCSECKPNAHLTSPPGPSSCLCDDAYYLVTTSGSCAACYIACSTCVAPGTSAKCTLCKANAAMNTNPGTCTCLDGYYPNGSAADCQLCDSTCVKCSSGTNAGCTTCYSNAAITPVAATGTCACVTSYWPNTSSAACAPCDPTCLNCVDSLSTSCTSCLTNAALFSTSPSSCVCNTGFYRAGTNPACVACDLTCKNCVGGLSSQCSECKPNAHLTSPPGPSSCLCDDAYYLVTVSGSCAACYIACSTCVAPGTSAKCTLCKANAAMSTNPGTCTCLDGYYPNGSAADCQLCDSTCVKCSSGTNAGCTTCYTNAAITPAAATGTCACVTSYWPNTSSAACAPCDPTCLNCNDSLSTSCTSCLTNAVLFSASPSSCVCVTGYYRAGTNPACVACDLTCKNCVGGLSSQCSECKPNAHLTSPPGPSSCLCDNGFYLVTGSGSCAACYITCSTCVAPGTISVCTQCKANASSSTNPGTCTCLDGYFPSTTAANCLSCDPTCAKCTSAAITGCIACFTHASITPPATTGKCSCDSHYWPNSSSASCTICDPMCLECSGSLPTNCKSCLTNAALLGAPPSSCVCITSFYRVGTNPPCLACDPTCKNCVGGLSSQCNECWTSARLIGAINPGSCECVDGFFPDSTVAHCSACHLTCALCNAASLSSCTACYPNAHILAGAAVGKCVCLDSTFPDTTPAHCTPCFSTCFQCSAAAESSCTVCYPQAIIQGGGSTGKCICPSSFWPNGSSVDCRPCLSSCLECISATLSTCTQCKSNATLTSNPGTCLCNVGYYPNTDAGNCALCNNTCKTCDLNTSIHCLSCKPNAHMTSLPAPSSCICDNAYFLLTVSGDCTACNITCSTCIAPGTISACTQCKANASLNSNPGTCTCVDHYFPNGSAADCQPCHPTCSQCINATITGCTVCYSYASIIPTTATGQCLCDSHYWPNPSPALCTICDPTCLDCISSLPNKCTSCLANAGLLSASPSSCVCDIGFYRSGTNPACLPCDPTCKNCVEALSSQCSECKSYASLVGAINPGTCECDGGFFPDSTPALCSPCDSTCALCNAASLSSCTACNLNAQILAGAAVGKCVCLDSTFPDPTPGHCTPCFSTCFQCVGAADSDCIVCYSHAIIQGGGATGKCVCSSSFWPNGSSADCRPCLNTCLECVSDIPSSCTQCKPHASLLSLPAPSSCVCDPGFIMLPLTGNCRSCDDTCKTCVGYGMQLCLSCHSNASLKYNASPSLCLCNDGYYPSDTSASCVRCDETCRLCEGSGPTMCVACYNFAHVVDPSPGACICSQDAFPDPNVMSCRLCSTTCETCIKDGPHGCSSCRLGAYLLTSVPSECVCVDGFYPNPDPSLCTQCDEHCKECLGPSQCVRCNDDSVLSDDGTCACADGFYDSDSECIPCPLGCQSCLATGCLSCDPSQLFFQSLCLSSCPRGYQATLNRVCIPQPGPTALLEVTETNSLVILFSRPMNCTLTSETITVYVTTAIGDSLSVVWSDGSFDDPQSVMVGLRIQAEVIPEGTLVELWFENPDEVKDRDGLAITVKSLKGVLRPVGKLRKPGWSPSTTSIVGGSGIVLGIVSSLLGGGGFSVLLLVNQFQLITYLPLSSLPLETDFAEMLIALNTNYLVPSTISESMTTEESSQKPTMRQEDYGIQTTLFIPNFSTFGLGFLLVLSSAGPIWLLTHIHHTDASSYFQSILSKFRWCVLLNAVFVTYLDLGVYGLLQVASLSFQSFYCGVNAVIGVIAVGWFLGALVGYVILLYSRYEELGMKCSEVFKKRWDVLLSPFSPHYSGSKYYFLFLSRRFLLALSIFYPADAPFLFSILNVPFAVAVTLTQAFLYVVITRPFSATRDQSEAIVIECGTMVVYVLAGLFSMEKAQSILNICGVWAVWGIVLASVAIPLSRLVLQAKTLIQAVKTEARLRECRTANEWSGNSKRRGGVIVID